MENSKFKIQNSKGREGVCPPDKAIDSEANGLKSAQARRGGGRGVFEKFCLLFTAYCLLFTSTALALTCDPGGKKDRLNLDAYNGSLHGFVCNVEACCLGKTVHSNHACVSSSPGPAWNFTQQDQLIQQHNMAKYPDLGSVGGATSLEEIQKVYLDTMDNIMNCAVDRMKYQLNREIISGDALGGVKLPDPIISVFEQLNQRIQSQLKQNKCLNPTDDGDVTQSKKLLDSLMYEECVGQYYKLYYANVVRNNLGTGLAGKQVTTVMEIKESSRALLGKIAGEASVSQATISDAMEMYMPISETYVPHVLLEVIRMQLLEIKRYMSIELTAMKYLFSKAVYAQKAAE